MAPGDERGGHGAQEVSESAIAARVDMLIARGLERYGEGDLVGALSEWEHARALDPEVARATEYIEYVRANFEPLEAQFRQARAVALAAAAQGVPVPAGLAGGRADEDAYDKIELGSGGGAAEFASSADTRADGARPEWPDDDEEEGWALAELPLAEPLPPTPAAALQKFAGGLDVLADGLIAVPGGEQGDGAAELAADEALRRRAPPGEEDGISDLAGLDFELAPPGASPAAGRDRKSAPRADAEAWLGPAGKGKLAGKLAEAGKAASPRGTGEEEITLPGGAEPPPLPERPALSLDAFDAAATAESGRRPIASDLPSQARHVPDDFDLSELGHLDQGGARDDRIEPTGNPIAVRVSFHDVGTGELTLPGPKPGAGAAAVRARSPRAGSDPGITLDDDATIEEATREKRMPDRDAGGTVDFSDLDLSDLGLDADEPADEEATVERAPHGPGEEFAGEFATKEHRSKTPITQVSVAGGHGMASLDELVARLEAEIERDAPAGESAEDRVRRRVTALIKRAEAAHAEGKRALAAAAVNRALANAPESAAAQKAIHRHRDLVILILEAYVGSERGVPVVAVPMHEIAVQEIDSRAAFLLSRIDGTLSLEELLDVAGMSRLEAYHYLARLLLRGLIEVR
jgi:hypothetical protein